MSPIKAHLHCLENMPKERVRTVYEKPKPGHGRGGKLNVERLRAIYKRVDELIERGWSRKDIAVELNISTQAIGAYLRGEIKCLRLIRQNIRVRGSD